MSLVTVDDLDVRGVEYDNILQAEAAIADASGIARASVAPFLDDVEAPDAPAAVVAIVVNMVRRVISNPRALAQEQLGDYMYSTGGQAPASLLPTAREKKMLRKAVGAPGMGSADMAVDLPVQSSELYVNQGEP